MWPCVALDGPTWPYRLGSRPFREARRDPAWLCAAQMGLAPVQTCPTPGRRRVPRRCRLPFGRLRATKPVRECLFPPETQNGEQLTRPPPARGVEEDRACAATEECPSSSEPQRMRD